MRLAIYIIVGFLNVFLHTSKNIIIIKYPSKFVGSLSNCICYTFSTVVIKFIAEYDMLTALCVQAVTNFLGCYTAMRFTEWILKNKRKDESD